MRSMDARFIKLLALVVIVGLSSCQRQPSLTLVEASPPQSVAVKQAEVEAPTVALVMKTLTNPFFIEMEKGARQAESKLGIHLLVQTAAQETSIEQQLGIIESLIQSKDNAIVIAPGDSVALIPVLKKAQDAGIVIINIDNRLDTKQSAKQGLVQVPFISVDNEQGAYLSAKFVSRQIQRPTKAAILEGIQTAKNAEDRKRGALQAFRENPKITDIYLKTANWKIDEAFNVTRNLFSNHPDIRVIFCANDMMALGALKYLAQAGRKDVLVAGFDALEEVQQPIKDGRLAVSIDQQANQQGYLGVDYASRALKGQPLPAETMVNVKVVTRDTLLFQR